MDKLQKKFDSPKLNTKNYLSALFLGESIALISFSGGL